MKLQKLLEVVKIWFLPVNEQRQYFVSVSLENTWLNCIVL